VLLDATNEMAGIVGKPQQNPSGEEEKGCGRINNTNLSCP
jgi:hypothetical protein